MRGLVLLSLLLFAAAAPLSWTPAARAADPHPAGDATAAASPWEHRLWHDATTVMRLYVCDHARRPPSWCAEPEALPSQAELPAMLGPMLDPEDARWQDFLKTAVPADLNAEELAMVRRRAVERRDPQAMEILGFLHAEGLSVERDYAEAYRWYGLAFLAGEQGVRANMDLVWRQLQRHDLRGAVALKREFDAVAAGEVPSGLAPAGDSAPESAPESTRPASPEAAPVMAKP